jgi:hypothetical protein
VRLDFTLAEEHVNALTERYKLNDGVFRFQIVRAGKVVVAAAGVTAPKTDAASDA